MIQQQTAGAATPSTAAVPDGMRRRHLLYAAPTIIFAGLAGALGWGLTRDPRRLPSALIGRQVPTFSLPPVQGRTSGLSSIDLEGEVSLVNVFASWCTACRQEHAIFMRLAESKAVPVHGLNYKDAPADAARWLDTLGDPYTRTGADRDGRVGIEWGMYGVPETYVVSRDGIVTHKHVGALTAQDLDETIMPLVVRLRGAPRDGRS